VPCFHLRFLKLRRLYNHSQHRNLLNKINLSRKLNKLRLMVMHLHQIKRHLISNRQRINHHLKMVLQLMRPMVKQHLNLSKQQMILLHLLLRQVQHHVKQQTMHLQYLRQHLHRSLHQRIMRHPHQWRRQLQHKFL
jgi:hypothetical protein